MPDNQALRSAAAIGIVAFCCLPAIAPAAEDPDADHLDVGVALSTVPTYPGAAVYAARVAPEFDIDYGRLLVNNDQGIGVYLVRNRDWRVSAAVGHEDLSDRYHVDSGSPRAQPAASPEVTAAIERRAPFGYLELAWFHEVIRRSANSGALEGGLYLPLPEPWLGELSLHVDWLDGELARRYFSPPESGNTPPASAGFSRAGVVLDTGLRIASRWILGTELRMDRLLDAATQFGGTHDWQIEASMAVQYEF